MTVALLKVRDTVGLAIIHQYEELQIRAFALPCRDRKDAFSKFEKAAWFYGVARIKNLTGTERERQKNLKRIKKKTRLTDCSDATELNRRWPASWQAASAGGVADHHLAQVRR